MIPHNDCRPGRTVDVRGMFAVLLACLVLALSTPGDSLAALVYRETFDSNPKWMKGGSTDSGEMIVSSGQAILQQNRLEPTDPDDIAGWWTSFAPWWGQDNLNNWNVRFQMGHTVELRTDVLRFSQDNAFAGLGVAANLDGYLVLLDRNEITLLKSSVAAGHLSHAFFFWDQVTLPPINLTLSAAFTEVDAGLSIRIRVLSTPQQTVLWETNVVDTPGLDAVLPNRAVKGILMEPEGIPAPYLGVDLLPLVGVWYGDPYAAPSGAVQVTMDNVQVWETQTPVADASASQRLYISTNGVDASVTLDGSRSADPDGDMLDYLWFAAPADQPAALLASGVEAVVLLPVGTHPLQLVVDDGMATATNSLTVEVITTTQSVERLIARVESSWERPRPLVATLYAALHSIERGNPVSAVHQLLAFQKEVRAQVAPENPALAAGFIWAAREIIDAVGGSKPGGRREPSFHPGHFSIANPSSSI